jgi:hypothetical protein
VIQYRLARQEEGMARFGGDRCEPFSLIWEVVQESDWCRRAPHDATLTAEPFKIAGGRARIFRLTEPRERRSGSIATVEAPTVDGIPAGPLGPRIVVPYR